MTKRKAGGKTELPPIAEVAAALAEQVRQKGALAKAAVTKAAKSSARSLEAFDALAAEGLEIGARFVRLPLESQLEASVRERGPLPVRTLATQVHGATPREASDAATALVERGRLQFVARQREILVAAFHHSDVLEPTELEKLRSAIAALTLSLATARKKRASLLRSDVEPLVRALRPRSSSAPAVESDMESEVARHSESSGLTSVPRLVRALGGAKARDAVHAELLRAARAGRLELRPESGMGRLSAEDLAFCIPGPQGTHLSWVRRIDESR